MKGIEEKLWDYIDGTCSAEERAAINLLLIKDEAHQKMYLELLALNREIAAMEIEEPSMAFTYKVMENIRADYAKQPLKTRVNNNIVKVIGGFFILSILALLIVIFANVNWSAASQINTPSVKIPQVDSLTASGLFKAFLFLDIVLVLFLFDSFLRKMALFKQP